MSSNNYSNFRRGMRDVLNSNIKKIIYSIWNSDPDIILSKNLRSPKLTSLLFPKTNHIYLVSGINQLGNIGLEEYKKNNTKLNHIIEEKESIDIVDTIIFNSKLTYNKFINIYNEDYIIKKCLKEIVNTSNCINIDRYDVTKKDIDIIIVCSDLERKVKNNLFLLKFISDNILRKYNKIIIGSKYKKYTNIPNVTCTGMLDNIEVKKYLSRSKLLLFPSLFDSSSNTIKEAVLYKNIVLTTLNVGYSENFPVWSICKTYDPTEWLNKTIHILKNYNKLIKTYDINFNSDMSIMQFIEEN